ncbi:MAG: hypothetical protein HYX34_05365 [Actinobacteria bacterium]|nr:hypothetical protein [Actinomycetota bacterium]
MASIAPARLAELAKKSLRVPAPGVGVAPRPRGLVNVAMWLWVDGFVPLSATASVPGVSATLTAVPARVHWDMGNGDTVTCAGPGKRFDFAAGVSVESARSGCSYTYRADSGGEPGKAFTVTATVTWRLTWASNVGAAGDLGEVSASSTLTYPVDEIQTLSN